MQRLYSKWWKRMKMKCSLNKCKTKPSAEVAHQDLQDLILGMIQIAMWDKLMKLKKNNWLEDRNIIERLELIEGKEMCQLNLLLSVKDKIMKFQLWKLNLTRCKEIIHKLHLITWFLNSNKWDQVMVWETNSVLSKQW